MKFWWILCLLAAVGIVAAAPPISDFPGIHTLGLDGRSFGNPIDSPSANNSGCGSQPESEPRFYNSVTKGFYVNGTTLPDVNFDVGESYAGNLPISNKRNESDELFFWFFPTANQEHQDDKEIVIWFNGGPGCSSLMALFLENGPISWQPGTLKPTPNPFSWHLLTNVVWIDQPVGTGFSKGNPSITNEDELAEQFKGFWRNFVDTFGMHGWKVYIAGESYAGMYGPYVASHFIDAKDADYFDAQGMIIYDGALYDQVLHGDIPLLPFVTRYQDILPLNDTMLSTFRGIHEDCGFTDYFERYLVFPPAGIQPDLTSIPENGTCGSLWEDFVGVATATSPCFNFYNIIDHCPYNWGAVVANPINPYDGNNSYLNRPEVQKAIHAPVGTIWTPCTASHSFHGTDLSPPPGLKQLPQVIDKTKNVILAQGGVDAMFTVNGVVLGIQNMTWGGVMGFQYQPQDPFYVPNYGLNIINSTFTGYGSNSPASFGVLGTTHHERGLTLVATKLAGHQGPGYAPAASFRHLEKLLGRVKSLSGTEPFTLPWLRNISQPAENTLGKGTMPIP